VGVPWQPCNISGFNISGFNIARFLISLKHAPQTMQFMCTIKKWQVWIRGAKTQSGETPSQIRPSLSQNMSASQYSCIFQEPMNRGKYVYVGIWVKYALGKGFCVSTIPPAVPKNREYPFPCCYSSLQLTVLLLKSFRLRIHCYTLIYVYTLNVHIIF